VGEGGPYEAAQRRVLEAALQKGATLRCPYCQVELNSQPVEGSREVAYVRRRVWVICPRCRRTASLDMRR
jgi:uncharacterized protein with PIN domain